MAVDRDAEQHPTTEPPRIRIAEPEVTVLSDHAIDAGEWASASFQLDIALGPVFDILRHPETVTPMAVAVYGAWGTGKTSAMRWLEGQLEAWNDQVIEEHRSTGRGRDEAELAWAKEPSAKKHVRVRPVWFHPWKYSKHEDVWRGLIAEIIIETMRAPLVRKDIGDRLSKAARRFGGFLGRSFLTALENIEINLPAGATFKGEMVRGIWDEWQKTDVPEKGYLNEFESTLEHWVKDCLAPGERLVVFVDDLDRCLPEVALEVLEALKLCLRIEHLVFVVGVDRHVVRQLIEKHYHELGVAKDRSRQYLAKMFQVEVEVSPREDLMGGYVEAMIDRLNDSAEGHWADMRKRHPTYAQMLTGVLSRMAGRNPREVKRLLNSALVVGAGATKIRLDGDAERDDALLFAQGIQTFLLQKLLDRWDAGHEIMTARAQEFFEAWSSVKDEQGEPVRLHHEPTPSMEPADGPDAREHRSRRGLERARSDDAPDEHRAVYRLGVEAFGARFDEIRRFETAHGDEPFVELMRMPFEPRVSIAARDRTEDRRAIEQFLAGLDEEVVRRIERAAGRPADEMGPTDLDGIRALDLSGMHGLRDVSFAAECSGLEWLSLDRTGVIDLGPLAGCTGLEWLWLDRTGVSDLGPLSGCAALQVLSLDGTAVSDEEVASLQNALPDLTIRR